LPQTNGEEGKWRLVANLGTPLDVVAHDFGAWVAYTWPLFFADDFGSLTLMEAGIPGVTLSNDA
jgi:pimeloyl-ACP methyl ester carboxylesterase